MRSLSLLCIVVASAAALGADAADAASASPPAYARRRALARPTCIWTNSALTFLLRRPPIFKALIAADKEEAMLLAGFQANGRQHHNPAPHRPQAAGPAVVRKPQADYIEMDLHLARINGQPRCNADR